MKYQKGNKFIHLTMEVFEIAAINEDTQEYNLNVYNDEGELERQITLTKNEMETDSEWEQII